MGTYDEMDASEIERSEAHEVCQPYYGLCVYSAGLKRLSLGELDAYNDALDAAGTCQENP